MEIIKPGRDLKAEAEQEYLASCDQCDCKFKFKKREMRNDYKNGNYVVCPNETCKYFVSVNLIYPTT